MAVAPSVPGDYEEIVSARSEVEAELERICLSRWFRTSRRSCEFLRFVVRATLDGQAESLKERVIGMDLLGRDASYDPGSDASVRVRANDVRKRLLSCYSSSSEPTPVRIVLPTGSYVPQFVQAAPAIPEPVPSEGFGAASASREPSAFGLWSWRRAILASLAVLSLVVCGLLLRARLNSHPNFDRFWSQVFTGHRVILLSVPEEERKRLGSGLYPLVWIAGRFGVPTVLTSGALTGATTDTFAKVRLSSRPPENWASDKRLHWLLEAEEESPTLVVRGTSGRPLDLPAPHAALLTVLPESPAILYVQSTDEDALRKLFEELTASDRFPSTIEAPIARFTPLQVLLTVDAKDQSALRVWESQGR